MELDQEQSRAVDLMTGRWVSVITGGPGTGKTTTLVEALRQFEKKGLDITLCAPTGKAARRIGEVTGHQASTIHRLLGYDPVVGFTDQHLDTDVVVVDESSMVDVLVGAALLRCIGPECGLVLIGDVQQLPSVGPGSFLEDIIESSRVPVAWLETVHRAAEKSWVCRNAPLIIRGEMPETEDCSDFSWIKKSWPRQVSTTLRSVVEELWSTGVQVLTPQHNGPLGTVALNHSIREAVNPDAEQIDLGKDGPRLCVGDAVVQTRNNYGIGVFNGETGTITGYTKSDFEVRVDFGDRVISYDKKQAYELRPAYALTVHKYQGSEVPWVVVVCHSTHHYMLDRRLLYTAVTRAKTGVILVGDPDGLPTAVNQNRSWGRRTLLPHYLKQWDQPQKS